MSRKTGKLE